ncbi:MAG TPA: hypothetical protein VNL77_22620 [Roseiflexaceae bacterium]|nr:hypothetical protein [Roseiflexaceae bacterium]
MMAPRGLTTPDRRHRARATAGGDGAALPDGARQQASAWLPGRRLAACACLRGELRAARQWMQTAAAWPATPVRRSVPTSSLTSPPAGDVSRWTHDVDV